MYHIYTFFRQSTEFYGFWQLESYMFTFLFVSDFILYPFYFDAVHIVWVTMLNPDFEDKDQVDWFDVCTENNRGDNDT